MILCSYSSFIEWLHSHLITCPFKKLTGYDCPGCGFQRSVIALFKGDISNSLHLYPAAIPILISALVTAIDAYAPFDQKGYIKKALYISSALVVSVSYLFKLNAYLQH